MSDRHDHQCPRCGASFSCAGPLQRNDDGWPTVVCTAQIPLPQLCDDCEITDSLRERADREAEQ